MSLKLKKDKDGSMTISSGRNRLTLSAEDYDTLFKLREKMIENPGCVAVEADGDMLIISQPLQASEPEPPE